MNLLICILLLVVPLAARQAVNDRRAHQVRPAPNAKKADSSPTPSLGPSPNAGDHAKANASPDSEPPHGSSTLRDVLIGAVVGGLFVIGGSFLAFLLTERATRQRETRNELRQITSVRTLLRLEADQNLESLNQFWRQFTVDPHSFQDAEFPDESRTKRMRIAAAEKLAILPSLRWRHAAWESQLSFTPLALNANEIEKTYNFHWNLDSLTNIQATLVTLKTNQEEQIAHAQIAPPGRTIASVLSVSRKFDQLGPSLFDDFTTLAEEISSQGNPLPQKKDKQTDSKVPGI